MRELALKILQEETDGFESQSRLRDDVLDAMVRFEKETKQCDIAIVSKRYDANKYTPPFRVGRKQSKAVLDGKGLEVVFFIHSEEQAKMYCDYLNNVC